MPGKPLNLKKIKPLYDRGIFKGNFYANYCSRNAYIRRVCDYLVKLNDPEKFVYFVNIVELLGAKSFTILCKMDERNQLDKFINDMRVILREDENGFSENV